MQLKIHSDYVDIDDESSVIIENMIAILLTLVAMELRAQEKINGTNTVKWYQKSLWYYSNRVLNRNLLETICYIDLMFHDPRTLFRW